MLHISFFIAKNNVRLLILSLLFLILVIIGIIFYLDYSRNHQINQKSGLIGYAQLQEKIKSLASDKEIASSNYYLRALEKVNAVSDKKLSEKDRYDSLAQARIFISTLYSNTNNTKLYPLQLDLRNFAKENFPKLYSQDKDFTVTCVDPTCAEIPQPPEILEIVEDLKASTLSAELKNDLTIHILNVGYLPKSNTRLRAAAYIIMLDLIKDYFNITKGGTHPIAEKMISYIMKNYPEEYKKVLELSKVKSQAEILKEKQEAGN